MKSKQAKQQNTKPETNNETIFNYTLFASVVCAVVFAVIFFSHRNEDVGRFASSLSSFLSSFSTGKIFGFRALADNTLGVLIAALITFSWFGLGDLIVKIVNKIFKNTQTDFTFGNRFLDVGIRCALGSGVWSLCWFFFGIAHLYKKPVAVVCLLVGIGFAFFAFKNTLKSNSENENTTSGFTKVSLVFVIIPVALAFIAAVAPPTGKDALIYHLALPKEYVKAGALIEVTNNIASFYSHGAEMNGVWAMLTGNFINERVGEVSFGVTLLSFFPLVLITIYGWSKSIGLRKDFSLLAAALFSTIPTVFYVASNGYIDLALTLYVVAVVCMVTKWWTTLDNNFLVFAAIALGAALAAKLTATFVFFPLLVVFLLRARAAQQDEETQNNANKILLAGILTLAFAAVLASPWYLNNLAKTGSPIFPFYQNIWEGKAQGWDKERSQLLQTFLSAYGGSPKSPMDFVAAPFYISLIAQPELANFYDGVIGISFLVGLIVVVVALWKLNIKSEVKIICGVAATLFFCWLFSSQQIRFLLPTLALMSVAIACSAESISETAKADSKKTFLSWILLASSVCGLMVSVVWFLNENPVRVVLGGETREDYLRRRLDHYPYYEIVNTQLPADAKVWLVNMRRDGYHLNRPYFSDYTFEDYTLIKYVNEANNLNELRARVRADGITHILVRHDVLLDYERSALVNEKRTPQENKAKMDLLKAFLNDGTKIIKSDKKFMLIELPK